MRKQLKLMLAGLFFLLAQTVFSQTVEVSGKVTDDQGKPVSGVSITEKGNARNGTATSNDGSFNLTVKKNATLVFSSVGFLRQEVAASAASKVSMTASAETISEVVVTSYGIKREKKALGYAVATVDAKALELRPESDVVRLLNGKAQIGRASCRERV